MIRQILLNKFKEDVEKNTHFVVEHFSNLNESQFNLCPAPDHWSIGQCLQYINMMSRHYLKQFYKVLKHGTKSDNTGNYKPGFLGKYLLKIITPISTKKYKTAKLFDPHFLVNGKACMDEFMDSQRRFYAFADKIKEYDLEKNKLDYTMTTMINLRLGDAFTLNNQHTTRHLNQALKVKMMENYPKG